MSEKKVDVPQKRCEILKPLVNVRKHPNFTEKNVDTFGNKK